MCERAPDLGPGPNLYCGPIEQRCCKCGYTTKHYPSLLNKVIS
jgi:hypothetical protein